MGGKTAPRVNPVPVRVFDVDGIPVLECMGHITQIEDALEFVAASMENKAPRVLLEAHHLPAAFFDLSTRFAGEFVQKLQNYRIRVAGVFPRELAYGDRFRELLSEAEHGHNFRVFSARADAEAWLAAR